MVSIIGRALMQVVIHGSSGLSLQRDLLRAALSTSPFALHVGILQHCAGVGMVTCRVTCQVAIVDLRPAG